MRRPDRRVRWIAGVAAVLLVAMQMPVTLAETTDERLQRLQKEVDELRQMLEKQQKPGPASGEAPPVVVPAPTADGVRTVPAANAVAPAPLRSGAFIRYYISNESLGEQPPAGAAPTVQGRFSDPDALSFDPAAYDVPESGAFSNYHDPASYRYVGLMVEGDLTVREAGEYQFILYPKPAREGGANVATRMSVWLRVDEQPVVEFRDQSSWRSQRGQLNLEPGVHRVRLWAVAASDGFGPSPTDSRLLLALKEPGDASPRPLRDLRPVQN